MIPLHYLERARALLQQLSDLHDEIREEVVEGTQEDDDLGALECALEELDTFCSGD